MKTKVESTLSVQQAVTARYQQMADEIDTQVDRLREGRGLCPPGCFNCCRNTATMAISEVEGRHLKVAFGKLPTEIRRHIFEKANRTIQKLKQLGYSAENETAQAGMEPIEALKGSPEAECPMLVGGICSVYEHRPVICRVWGYPIDNGSELACCGKTFIGRRRSVKPIHYAHYWKECRDLSQLLGANRKTPNCYLVVRLLGENDEEMGPECP